MCEFGSWTLGGSSLMAPEKEPRFVIHEHHARSHHFDLRLEREGVLVSWAVPKGMPTDPARNRLAVRVEDHSLDHIDFVDPTPVETPAGTATAKSIWDSGRYRTIKWEPSKVVVDLLGSRINARFAVFHTNGNQWMVHLMDNG